MSALFVAHDAPSAQWRAVHRVADASYPTVYARIRTALEQLVQPADVETALRMHDPDRIVAQYDFEPFARQVLEDVMPVTGRTYVRAHDVATRWQRAQRSRRLSKAGIDASAFQHFDQLAADWASQHAAVLVTNLTTQARQAVRLVVVDAFERQLTIDDVKRRLRTRVTLDTRSITALNNLETRLLASGVSRSEVTRQVSRAILKAQRNRYENIARTEVMDASNAGQIGAWQTAQSQGLLSNDLVKELVLTSDACEICQQYAGEQRAVNEAFSFGKLNPPVHPRCRCAVGLVYSAKVKAEIAAEVQAQMRASALAQSSAA